MRRLQRFLAIPMAASAAACLWLLYRQSGDHGLFIGAMFAMALVCFLLVAGLLQRRGSALAWLGALAAVAVVGIASAAAPHGSAAAVRVEGAEPWSDALLASYVGEGKPVFVYFTADWCLSCKVNEATSIDRDEVRDAFRKAGVKVVAGDWTRGDPAITRFLESQGRAGVPLYLWYAPGKPVEQLPQVLTPEMLISRARSLPQAR
jgi:thiol:disulfide interchange protein